MTGAHLASLQLAQPRRPMLRAHRPWAKHFRIKTSVPDKLGEMMRQQRQEPKAGAAARPTVHEATAPKRSARVTEPGIALWSHTHPSGRSLAWRWHLRAVITARPKVAANFRCHRHYPATSAASSP